MDLQIDLARLAAEFPGWDIGTVGRSIPPPGWNFRATRGGILLTDPEAKGLAEKIRREEAGG